MRESGFAGKRRLVKEFCGAGAETACFEVAAFVEEKEALIEVEKPGPDEIFFGGEHGPGVCEALEGEGGFSLLAVGDGFVGEGFCGFVANAELFKTKETFVGHFAGFFAEVQLEIDLRKIQVAECEMIGVAGYFAGAARGKKHFDGAAVFASKIVQVGDVVIGLIAQQWHPEALARFASFLITCERPGKVIQADQAHRHVAEDDGYTFCVLIRQQTFISALVLRNSLLEAILAVKDVAKIDIETCETPRVVETGEDSSGPIGSFERFIVLTQ